MRGALTQWRVSHLHTGIIPADAGSTYELGAWDNESEDHPRGCGEHVFSGRAALRIAGSSPRMRGAPRRSRAYT